MRTIGVTAARPSRALAICARLSMYCRQSRSSRPSHGLCSISNTQPSYLEVLIAIARSDLGGRKAGERVLARFEGADDAVQTRKIGHASSALPCGTRRHPIRSQSGFDNAEPRFVASAPNAALTGASAHNSSDGTNDHRLSRPLHDRAEGPAPLPQGADRRPTPRTRRAMPSRASLKMTDDEIRESIEGTSSSCSASAAPT